MVYLLFWLESAVLTALLYLFNASLHPVWILPLLVGFFLAFCILFVSYLEITSFFLPKGTPERPHRFAFLTIRMALPWFVSLLGTRLRVRGKEKLPPEPTVLVCNHRSAFDPVFIVAGLHHRKMAFVSKKSVQKYAFIGPYMNAAAFVFIDRDSPMQAMRAIHRAAGYVKNEGIDYGIFPEGTRSRSGELLEFKNGAFLMAKKASAPITVLTMQGSETAISGLPFHRPNIRIEVVGVIAKEDVAALSQEEISARVRAMMEASLQTTNPEKKKGISHAQP